MRQRYRFSLRGILFLTTAIALAIPIAMGWQSLGMFIGPALFLLSLAGSVTLWFARHKTWCRIGLRCSISILLCVVLLYASFGPATWAMARYNLASVSPHAGQAYSFIYVPIAINIVLSPEPIRTASMRYTEWWMPNGVRFMDWGDGIGWNVPGRSYTIVSI